MSIRTVFEAMVARAEDDGHQDELLANVLRILGQLKVLHWQTESFAEHKAFGEIYDSLEELLDRLIEAYAGKYQRPKLGGCREISVCDYDELDLAGFLDEATGFLSDLFTEPEDSELANIRDEARDALDKLRYLLSLK